MKCRPIEEVVVVVNPSELSEEDEESGVTEAGDYTLLAAVGCIIFLVFFLIRCEMQATTMHDIWIA
jgi:hypothetical protein